MARAVRMRTERPRLARERHPPLADGVRATRLPAIRPLLLVSVAALIVRIASAVVVAQPGYTDAYYYSAVASRLAHGDGLTADFIWNFLEAPNFAPLTAAHYRVALPVATTPKAGAIAMIAGTLRVVCFVLPARLADRRLVPAARYGA